MGMPISSYSILKGLGEQKGKYARDTALSALQPFSLFAFVIHDPEAHPEFNRQLNALFDQLDFITGSKLLFFALVDPPTEWLSHARDREYYKRLGSWETQELLNPRNSIASADAGMTAFALASSLRIPSEMLPCIVVTQDFDSEAFELFRTSSECLEEQLKRLGYIAARGVNHLNHLAEIDLCKGSSAESLQSSLAKALSDVLSFVVANDDSDLGMRRTARDQARKTISELYSKLKQLKGKSDKEEALDELCVRIASSLSLLNTRKDITLSGFMPIDTQFLEGDSLRILKTAHIVFDLLISKQSEVTVDVSHTVALDFTPGVICLSKVFEKEVNLSIVHWMREELGISLPQYFNKPQPSRQATYFPQRGRPIYFNSNLQGRWKAPGIGESEFACRDYVKDKLKLPYGWDSSTWNLLLGYWETIRKKRNEAAHTEVVDEAALLTVKRSLESLAKSQMFEKFYLMKTKYRDGR